MGATMKFHAKFCIAVLLGIIPSAFAQDFSTHIAFTDSARHHEVSIGAQLVDSLAVTNLTNAPTHYDNSASVRLFLNGHFTERFLFNARVKVSTDHTNKDINDHFYNPSEGIPYNKQSDNKRTWDIFAASASYDLDAVKLLAGFDYLSMGPARRNHVILRGEQSNYRPWQDSTSRIFEPAPTPYFGYQFELGPIVYSQYAMKLFEKKNFGKYMHVHRLDLSLPQNITLGLSETALYGSTTEEFPNPNEDADSSGREFEWAYVIPFIPYVFQEHLQGDQDNISLAFDLSVKTIPNWEFYGELLWDDMKSPTSMFDDSWWGNKWAASVGVARDSLRIKSTLWDWYLEYTRVEPWVYTHHKGGGYTYRSYAQSLGTDLGPNSREVYTEVNVAYPFTSGFLKDALLKGGIHASAVAKDTAFGGNITDMHTPESDTDKKFLAKHSTLHYVELGSKLEFRPRSWVTIRMGYDRYFGDYEGFRAMAGGSFQY
ncbi:MAG: hypothetical protein IKO21_00770 [Fibrobacter sp.]|nr:hypothetical protein [Fibrobacter sp.]